MSQLTLTPLPVTLDAFFGPPRFVVRETAATYGVSPSDEDSSDASDLAEGPDTPVRASPDDGRPPVDLGFPEAGTVHELLRSLHRIGNEARMRFIEMLRVFHDGNLCRELGYSSFHQYCDRELGLPNSTAHEYLRAARALDGLPRLRALFGQGELSWPQVRAITRVATTDTELTWIEFAYGETVRSLLVEVREAVRSGRDAPRDKRYGLPNLLVRLSLDLTLEDKERVRAAFALVSAGPGPDLGGWPGDASDCVRREPDRPADPRPPLVRWADGILSGEIPSWPVVVDGGQCASPARPAPAQTILYRTCPECRETTLDTPDGPVAVAPARIDELAPISERVVISREDEPTLDNVHAEVTPPGQIDAPNNSRLTVKVLKRDGDRCRNPGCGRRLRLHAHHIRFRSRGGPSALGNEVAVCDICHALIHEGLLDVDGSPETGLTWQPRPYDSSVSVREIAEMRATLDTVAAAISASAPSPMVARQPNATSMSPRGDSALVSDLAEGLRRLGWKRADAEQRVREAIHELRLVQTSGPTGTGPPDPLQEGDILMKALRG